MRATGHGPQELARAARSGLDEGAFDVRLDNVTKRFGDAIAVDSVSLDIRRGEFLSLLGPSGCGKTTTLKLIAGFEEPTEGAITIGDQAAAGLPPHKRDVNTVFQNYALFGHFSVLDNVAYGLKQRGVKKAERRAQAADALELVGLRDRAASRPNELSGGQQQRVALARALVLRPRVLLLDEPLGALDRKLREAMQIELKRIHAEVGLTFVFVTHDQGEALSMSDRIAVMHRGRIEQLAEPQVVYDAPASPFVASFIGEMNTLTGRLEEGAVAIGDTDLRLSVTRVVVDAECGESARAGVRPQDVSVSAAAPSTAHGRIETQLLTGHSVRLVVVLKDGQRLVARQNRYHADPLQPGVDVRIDIAPDSVLLLGPATKEDSDGE